MPEKHRPELNLEATEIDAIIEGFPAGSDEHFVLLRAALLSEYNERLFFIETGAKEVAITEQDKQTQIFLLKLRIDQIRHEIEMDVATNPLRRNLQFGYEGLVSNLMVEIQKKGGDTARHAIHLKDTDTALRIGNTWQTPAILARGYIQSGMIRREKQVQYQRNAQANLK
jgi:hypothetical protein